MINKSSANIPTFIITKVHELIYAGAKLFCDEIVIPKGNSINIQNLDGKLD